MISGKLNHFQDGSGLGELYLDILIELTYNSLLSK